MNLEIELQLLRLFQGELSPEQARALAERLEREPELAAAHARLRNAWEGLALPPAAPAPLGFTNRVMAEVRSAAAGGGARGGLHEREGWSLAMAPTWVRRTAAAALIAGVALGAGIGLRWPAEDSAQAGTISLVESYRAMVNDAPPVPAAAPRPEYRP
jgi:anti-sigma factor RsiW